MEFKKYKIKDIGKVAGGATPNTKDSSNYDGDISWITPNDLSRHKEVYISRGERNITEKGLKEIGNTLLPEGTVLFSSRAPIGYTAIAKNELCTNQGFKSVIPFPNIVSSEYLYYTLSFYKSYIEKQGSGTTFMEVSGSTMENIELPLPPLEHQINISKVLIKIDEKIALNTRINAELEAMAKQLYDYWFVQFDFPDENGKPYKSSGGKMVYNEKLKREIPEGWEVRNLFHIANYYNGLACQNFRPQSGEESLPVIKISEMHNGFSSETERATINIPQEAIVENGDVLFAWSASLEVMLWGLGKGALNQHIFKVISNNGFPKSFYYYQLLEYVGHFKKIAEAKKTTMGHITKDHLEQSLIVVPPTISIPLLLENILSPIMDKIVSLSSERIYLTNLRDSLLPMLMNGQVTIE